MINHFVYEKIRNEKIHKGVFSGIIIGFRARLYFTVRRGIIKF